MSIVLDTNIVRALGAGELLDSQFEGVVADGVSIHVSDTAAAELVHALVDERMDWSDWGRARDILMRIVDEHEPILLGGGLGLIRAGIVPGDTLSDSAAVADAIEAYAAGWRLLRDARTRNDLVERKVALGGSDYGISGPSVGDVMAREKQAWIEEFSRFEAAVQEANGGVGLDLPSRGDSRDALEVFCSFLKREFDEACPGIEPPGSVRLDAFLRVHALLRLRRVRSADRYNPEKDVNDAFDHYLLKYLAIPAAVCTGDNGIISDVLAARSWQSKWILRPEVLSRDDVRQELVTMEWPAHVSEVPCCRR